jgi:predicted GNAT family N-acyltransferase
MTVEVRRTRGPQELEAALALREEVFVGEQGVTPEGDRDGRDEEALQLVAVDGDGAIVGTCRLLMDGRDRARFGRLCVRRDRRRSGIARALRAQAEREARASGCASIGLHAQTDAMRLYEEMGYRPYGGRFDDEGIEHQAMEKDLG